MKKWRYLALSLPLAVAGYLWLGHAAPSASAAAQSTGERARPRTIIAPARVEPEHDAVQLAFEVQGRIAEIAVEEGQAVTAGEVLARLDDRLAKARVASAEAAVAQAKARYQLARRGARREDLDAARAEADAAVAQAEHRAVERVRSDALGAEGAIATSAVEADGTAARVATATARASTARYQALANGTRVEQLDELAAALAGAQADLEAANVALGQTVLRAPSDGVILRRISEVGAMVTLTAPAPVVSMANLRTLEIRAELDESDVAMVSVGQTAYATADAFGDRTFPVVVTRITRELGRKVVRDDDPRARVDTRVLEVIAKFSSDPKTELPLGLRMYMHVGE